MTTSAEKLALWIRSNHKAPLTHLKLQKLVFYCHGIGSSFGHEGELGNVTFEAWKHGPVARDVWLAYRNHGSCPIEAPLLSEQAEASYSADTESDLHDVLTVYGALDAWSLRQQSHLEQPWAETFKVHPGAELDPVKVRDHFFAKFASGSVTPPEYLVQSWQFGLDDLPVGSFANFHALAEAVFSVR